MKKLIVLLFSMLLCGCGFHEVQTVEPNDDLSKYINSCMGDSIKYLGLSRNKDGVTIYTYYAEFESLTPENIASFVDAVSSYSNDLSEKVRVELTVQIPDGTGGGCSLQNYLLISYDGNSESNYIEYSDLCVYTISWQTLSDPILQEPSTFFSESENIRYLLIASDMQAKAESEGIDWYSIWPNLEGIETF